jgi:hypothetical protein
MDRKTRWIGGGALAVALIGGGTGVAMATGGDDRPLPVSALEKATAAALHHTGGGTIIETDAGDGGAAHGVEIRLDDGRVVEIGLDTKFQVIGQESDDDGSVDAESNPD